MPSDKPERYESDFSYQPLMNKPQMKTYITPEFQHELREATENHMFKQKLANAIVHGEKTMIKNKLNRLPKGQNSIVADPVEKRSEVQTKMHSESNNSTPVCDY